MGAFFLILTQFKLLYEGWRGYIIAWFALVWVANIYMSVYNRLRLEIKHENVVIARDTAEEKLEEARVEALSHPAGS